LPKPGRKLSTVTAFGTRKGQDAIAARGVAASGHVAEPVAGVPARLPRRHARPWKPATADDL
jgi:hypothetical protein